ncbi:hypothetical protein [Bradyrhizobium arachidis]|uniref:hypothetical protein n=1 Tax=Bradyrhizobium arachidis TaxID=858423 RepID=UPI0021624CC7|nr:hypothetical protein [Bradyrhizobium arachidis]UVO30494.1 hypothetical protein KUF59_07415 [Bradyrhizobium arachidis]
MDPRSDLRQRLDNHSAVDTPSRTLRDRLAAFVTNGGEVEARIATVASSNFMQILQTLSLDFSRSAVTLAQSNASSGATRQSSPWKVVKADRYLGH